ncbi:MAG: hypothetical protein U0Z44_02310 [Kouleothrix sp.]|jgi:hypothetical protein|nr:hypothetical protein [Kouleothrix sp.]
MTTLSVGEIGEVRLTLRGEDENRILATVRRWPHWLRVDIERDPGDPQRCLAITLVADRIHEPIVRDILKRSFGITFPETGGDAELPPEAPPRSRKRRWH